MEKTAFDDEAERRLELAEKRRQEQSERLRDAYNQLKYTAVSFPDPVCYCVSMRSFLLRSHLMGSLLQQ